MNVRPGVILGGTIAAAAAAGILVSLVQKTPPSAVAPRFTPVNLGPTPVPHRPSVAFEFSVAGDPFTGQVMLFGGVDNFDSTWLWNGRTWTLAHPQRHPSGRYGAAAAYDPQSGQVLLFGGRLETGAPTADTWGWDGRNWQQLNDGRGGPPAGDGADMAWSPASNQMMLVTAPASAVGGGETWIWAVTHWVRQTSGQLGSSYFGIVVGYDPVTRSMLAEGCCERLAADVVGAKATTWRWDGRRWRPVAAPVNPPDGTSMAIDPGRGQLVLCSCDLVGGVRPALWRWNGANWVPAGSGTVPTQPQAEVEDGTQSQLLVLGTAIPGAESIAQPVEVWLIDGGGWRALDRPPAPG
jgi:hypothetical protein